jgi:hypothetical protein
MYSRSAAWCSHAHIMVHLVSSTRGADVKHTSHTLACAAMLQLSMYREGLGYKYSNAQNMPFIHRLATFIDVVIDVSKHRSQSSMITVIDVLRRKSSGKNDRYYPVLR